VPETLPQLGRHSFVSSLLETALLRRFMTPLTVMAMDCPESIM
jgi:hypothetical protein